jgi:hypothetical protein
LIKGPEGDLTVYITLRDQNAGLGHWKQRSRSEEGFDPQHVSIKPQAKQANQKLVAPPSMDA